MKFEISGLHDELSGRDFKVFLSAGVAFVNMMKVQMPRLNNRLRGYTMQVKPQGVIDAEDRGTLYIDVIYQVSSDKVEHVCRALIGFSYDSTYEKVENFIYNGRRISEIEMLDIVTRQIQIPVLA